MATVLKSGSLNLLEPSGFALPFLGIFEIRVIVILRGGAATVERMLGQPQAEESKRGHKERF